MANCGATQSPTFQPALRIIDAITQANPAEITTTFAHNFSTGLIVRLYVPQVYGMVQANHFVGPVTVTSDVTFTVNLNTEPFDPFVVPSSPTTTREDQVCSLVVPVGEVNNLLSQATRNVL